MTDVCIVGGGIIGAACAFELATQGASVTVMDADLPNPASQAAAGALKPFDALQKGRKAQLQRQSLQMYPGFAKRVEKACGMESTYTPSGRLHVSHTAADFQHAQHLYPEASQSLPYLAPCAGLTFEADTAMIDPIAFQTALRKAGEAHGVRWVTGTYTDQVKARHVVHATGGWHTKVKPIRKHAVLLRWPHEEPLPYMLDDRHVYLLPRGKNSVYVGSIQEDAPDHTAVPNQHMAQQLRAMAARLIPDLADAEIIAPLCGLVGAGGLHIGPIPGHENHWQAVGHGGVGFCLAPLTAQEITKAVLRA